MLFVYAFQSLGNVKRILCNLLVGIGGYTDFTEFLTLPRGVVPRAIQPNAHLERLVGGGHKEEVESSLLMRLYTRERFQAKSSLIQTSKAEILEAHDVVALHQDRHVVVPNVPRVLLAAHVGKVASVTRGIILIGIHTKYLEAF